MRGLFDTTVVSVYSYRAALLESPSHVFWDKHGTLNYIAKERAVRHAKVSSFLRAIPSSRKRGCELSNFDVFEIHQVTELLFGSIRTVFRSSLAVARSRGSIAVHPIHVILIAIVTCTYRASSSAVDIG